MTGKISIAELLAGSGDDYRRATLSPDGRHAILTVSNEMGMSHWIDGAALYSMPDEALVAELGGSRWSTDNIAWAPDGTAVTVELRRYPGDVPGVSVVIDLEPNLARIDGGTALPLARLSEEIEADYFRRGGLG